MASALPDLPHSLDAIIARRGPLGGLVEQVLTTTPRCRGKGQYSLPLITQDQAGLARAGDTPTGRYHFTLASSQQPIFGKWYQINITGRAGSPLGIAIGHCTDYPNRFAFYPVGSRGSTLFKIWHGETQPPSQDFDAGDRILRARVDAASFDAARGAEIDDSTAIGELHL
jgi:hypothetical protein